MNNLFQKAVRTQKAARIFIRGTSGSGKTYSSLLLAKALADGKPIAVIDTEKNSSTLYTDDKSLDVDFDVIDYNKLYQDHNPSHYIELIDMAEKNGYKVLIIDSLSHAWIGKGGILEINEQIAQAKYHGNSFAAWVKTTPEYYNPLINKIILGNDIHIIATGRTKTEYEVTKDDQGKTKITKFGTKTQQREGLDYEFDIVLDLQHGTEGIASPDKDRTRVIHKDGERISVDMGKRLFEFYQGAKKIKLATFKIVQPAIVKTESLSDLVAIYNQNTHLHENESFKKAMGKKKEELSKVTEKTMICSDIPYRKNPEKK